MISSGPAENNKLPALEVSGIGKCFQLFDSPAQQLRSGLFSASDAEAQKKWALRGLNFVVERGSAYGIVGRNGSGKSTLLKIICGVMQPTEGQVITRGRVLGLLELGTGLNMELTGRQNVFASTSLLGFPRSYAQERMTEIESFADIGEFFDNPVKLYSSGMLMRLAFSLYLYMEPDILIVDEALSVGDYIFQKKCAVAMNDIRARGTTLLFVSHSLGTVKAICDRALLLEDGVMSCEGDVDEVLNAYLYPEQKNLHHDRRGQSRESDDSTPAEQRKAAALQILNELVPTPPADRPAAWRIVAQRSLNDLGVPAMLFQIGAVLQHETIVFGPPSAPLLGIEIELLDRFDRVITGRSVFLAAANRIAWGPGNAIAIVLRLPMDVVAGDYVFRLTLKGALEDVVPDSVMSNAISVYNALPFPPFHGIVGLPAQFRLEGRGTSGSGHPDKAEARTD